MHNIKGWACIESMNVHTLIPQGMLLLLFSYSALERAQYLGRCIPRGRRRQRGQHRRQCNAMQFYYAFWSTIIDN